ncbi:hypothetical protein BLI708_00415 [Bifidobacterium imperatoris]|uniref:Uncharacterized protein n=1 Tax=Bifidobacterium imperatoris TaxID=2020965 RepID=A0A2N5IP36_9BIFI|nr:hypothetical protein [Bifidobacterium imperatoris]PLS23731.1 hypothetical protein Tam1G_2217 [Bifidobacterium imperatoris]QSY57792.1 hypothetical protein BLI708_00120 [Bifidobacterium imperatoris]QSY57841.1 hypothetical protein BLI708_00415 [Bifidobacterium imperatoris]
MGARPHTLRDSLTHHGFQRADGGVVRGVLQPNAVTVQQAAWPKPFAEIPTVVGWYANDNIYSCSVTSVTTTGCTIAIKNIGEQANGIEGHVYAVAYGKLA